MGVRNASVFSNAIANVLPASAAETVICILPGINFSPDNTVVIVGWFVALLTGTGTTSLLIRIRRGVTTSGTQIGVTVWTHSITAANQAILGGTYFDTPGAVGGQQYCLTCIQAAATAAGTLSDLSMTAFVL